MTLAEKTCAPCRKAEDAHLLTEEETKPLLAQLKEWQIENNKKLVKVLKFDNFKQSMDHATKIAKIAEEQNHHPDLIVRWAELRIEIWTHTVNGLTENDFILAAKIDRL